MKKLSTYASAIREADERVLSELQKDWREYFFAKLNKFGVESPADLDDEKKKEFFNELKKDWERGKGATETGKKDIEKHGVKETKTEAKTVNQLDEARSIEKIQDEWSKTVKEMADTVKIWKKATGPEKDKILDKLKKLTAKKKNLEKELDDAVINKDKDIELVITDESIKPQFKDTSDESENSYYKLIDEALIVQPLGIENGVFYIDINGNKYGYSVSNGKNLNNIEKTFTKMLKFSAGKALAWLTKNASLISGSKKDLKEIHEDKEKTNEKDINSEDDFKKYSSGILKKTFGEKYNEKKIQEIIENAIKKANGNWSTAAKIFKESLIAEEKKDPDRIYFNRKISDYLGIPYVNNEGKPFIVNTNVLLRYPILGYADGWDEDHKKIFAEHKGDLHLLGDGYGWWIVMK
jgi:hypothetical protein